MALWKDDRLNILIPMAGAGRRFVEAGFDDPKPLIKVNGKYMIHWVIDSMDIDANYIFVVRKEHYEVYNLQELLSSHAQNCQIIQIDEMTEGPACTCLVAKDLINNDLQLIIANSDHYIEWDSTAFMAAVGDKSVDGGIVTFETEASNKWSYVKVDDSGKITDVVEKQPISSTATAGIYYFKRGSDFVYYANKMISDNMRVNLEFYVAPTFAGAIQDGKRIIPFRAKEMWGLGTPEDVVVFTNRHEKA